MDKIDAAIEAAVIILSISSNIVVCFYLLQSWNLDKASMLACLHICVDLKCRLIQAGTLVSWGKSTSGMIHCSEKSQKYS